MVCASVTACAPQPRFDAAARPDWVEGASQKFDRAHYFVGKGQAVALDVAAKQARLALAASLSALVGDGSAATLDRLVQQAEVVDAWHDGKTQEHHALVVLEHAAAAKLLRQQLAALDARTRQLIDAATTGLDPLQQIRATHDALATQQPRADLVIALRALGDDATPDEAVWTVTELQAHLKSLLGSIDVAPRVEGDRLLGSAVVRGLEAAGYLSKRLHANYVLKTTLDRSGMKWEQGWFTEQGTLSVELLDQRQQLVGKAQWPLKAQARERALLEKELMGEVQGTLETEFGDTLMGFIDASAARQ